MHGGKLEGICIIESLQELQIMVWKTTWADSRWDAQEQNRFWVKDLERLASQISYLIGIQALPHISTVI